MPVPARAKKYSGLVKQHSYNPCRGVAINQCTWPTYTSMHSIIFIRHIYFNSCLLYSLAEMLYFSCIHIIVHACGIDLLVSIVFFCAFCIIVLNDYMISSSLYYKSFCLVRVSFKLSGFEFWHACCIIGITTGYIQLLFLACYNNDNWYSFSKYLS